MPKKKALIPFQEGLIKQTPRDAVLAEIAYLQANHLTTRQKRELEGKATLFAYAFEKGAWEHLGFSREDLARYDPPKLEALGDLLLRKAREKMLRDALIALFCIPVLGWIGLFVGFFVHHRSEYAAEEHPLETLRECGLDLKKVFGGNWFPHAHVQKMIKGELSFENVGWRLTEHGPSAI